MKAPFASLQLLVVSSAVPHRLLLLLCVRVTSPSSPSNARKDRPAQGVLETADTRIA